MVGFLSVFHDGLLAEKVGLDRVRMNSFRLILSSRLLAGKAASSLSVMPYSRISCKQAREAEGHPSAHKACQTERNHVGTIS